MHTAAAKSISPLLLSISHRQILLAHYHPPCCCFRLSRGKKAASARIGLAHSGRPDFHPPPPDRIYTTLGHLSTSFLNNSVTAHRCRSPMAPVDSSRRAESNGVVGWRPLSKVPKQRSNNRLSTLRVQRIIVERGSRRLQSIQPREK